MDPSPIPTLLLLILLIWLSWFFSWAEIALVSLSHAQVRSMVRKKLYSCKTIEKLKSEPNKLLITILIWNNLVNIAASMITAIWANSHFWSKSLWVVTWILTLAILIFWEILPKSLAQRYSNKFASLVAKPMMLLYYIFYPFTLILEQFIKIFWWKHWINKYDDDELKAMVDLWAETWRIDFEKKELISNVLDFWETTVEQVMIDESKIYSMSSNLTINKAVEFFVSHEHSRVPIYKDTDKNEIIWILTLREILKYWRTRDWNLKLENLYFIKPMFTPESKRIWDLFKEFQWKRVHMAIVIDEFWNVSWLVTLENILEEVFWEIHDESDESEDEIKKLNRLSWRMAWDTELDKVNSALWVCISNEEHKTLSYYLLDLFQKIPERGDWVDDKWFEFFIEKMVWNKIESVRVQKNVQDNETKVTKKHNQ